MSDFLTRQQLYNVKPEPTQAMKRIIEELRDVYERYKEVKLGAYDQQSLLRGVVLQNLENILRRPDAAQLLQQLMAGLQGNEYYNAALTVLSMAAQSLQAGNHSDARTQLMQSACDENVMIGLMYYTKVLMSVIVQSSESYPLFYDQMFTTPVELLDHELLAGLSSALQIQLVLIDIREEPFEGVTSEHLTTKIPANPPQPLP